jgi:hypothetical protein
MRGTASEHDVASVMAMGGRWANDHLLLVAHEEDSEDLGDRFRRETGRRPQDVQCWHHVAWDCLCCEWTHDLFTAYEEDEWNGGTWVLLRMSGTDGWYRAQAESARRTARCEEEPF